MRSGFIEAVSVDADGPGVIAEDKQMGILAGIGAELPPENFQTVVLVSERIQISFGEVCGRRKGTVLVEDIVVKREMIPADHDLCEKPYRVGLLLPDIGECFWEELAFVVTPGVSLLHARRSACHQ